MNNIDNLERLIARIDELIAGLPAREREYDPEQWKAARLAEHDAFWRLVAEERGGARTPNDAVHLRLAGVSTSCTSGYYGAMRNWQAAARRRIAKLKEQADAADE